MSKKQQRKPTVTTGPKGSARARAAAEQAAAADKRQRNVMIGIFVSVVVVVALIAGGVVLAQRIVTPSVSGTFAKGSEQVIATPVNGQPIVYGEASAQHKMSVYLDFECPHCKTFEQTNSTTIRKNIEAGNVQVSYYILSFMTQNSPVLANAFVCAAERGFGQQMMIEIFNNQRRVAWTDQQIVNLGNQIFPEAGSSWETCVERNQNRSYVLSVDSEPKPADFKGTPYVNVDGKTLGSERNDPAFMEKLLSS